MFTLLNAVLLLFIGCMCGATLQAFKSCKAGHPFRETPLLGLLGVFVWGDALVIAPFWAGLAGTALALQDGVLFLMGASLFWVIRSLGEVQYWFNQQFSTIQRNPPERMRGYAIVTSDAVWYLYQIFWQCIAVVSSICAIYFTSIWIS